MAAKKKIKWDYKEYISEKNPEQILKDYDYDNGYDILVKIQDLDNNDEESLKAVLNEIVLWKCNRRIMRKKTTAGDDYGKNTEEQENNICKTIANIRSLKNVDEARSNPQMVQTIVESLITLNGIQLPMASTIMNFFNPATFPIIDKRAYRVAMKLTIDNDDTSQFLYKEPSRKNAGKYYIEYLEACKEVAGDNKIEFNVIDKFLYQVDKDLGNQVDGTP